MIPPITRHTCLRPLLGRALPSGLTVLGLHDSDNLSVARAPAENDARWGRHIAGPCVLEMAMDHTHGKAKAKAKAKARKSRTMNDHVNRSSVGRAEHRVALATMTTVLPRVCTGSLLHPMFRAIASAVA